MIFRVLCVDTSRKFRKKCQILGKKYFSTGQNFESISPQVPSPPQISFSQKVKILRASRSKFCPPKSYGWGRLSIRLPLMRGCLPHRSLYLLPGPIPLASWNPPLGMNQRYFGGVDPSKGRGDLSTVGPKKMGYFSTLSAPKAPKVCFSRRRRRREKFLSTFFEIFGKFVDKCAIKSD